MNKKIILYTFGVTIVACMITLIFYCFLQFAQIIDEVSEIKLYPENVPDRQVDLTEKFSLLWSKKTEEGNQYRVFTQLFIPDEQSIVYVTKTTLTSLEYETGDLQWSLTIPTNAFFYYYKDRLYSLTKYEDNILFAPNSNVSLPIECKYSNSSTLRVYDPHSGQKIWEYSYPFAEPDDITFKGNSAFINGFSIAAVNKYKPELEVDINNGEVLGFSCRNLNDLGYSSNDRIEGETSSGFWPVYDDLSWRLLKDGQLAIASEGTRLTMVNPENKQTLGFIEFSGSELNPYDVQMIFQHNILIVYLDDSDQFFAFQIQE